MTEQCEKLKDDEVWTKIMEKGERQEPANRGIANRLDKWDLETILATADYFGCNEKFMKQMYWDLTVARYRVFDWAAMLLNGRFRGYGEDSIEILAHKRFTRVIADAYLKGEGVEGFIDILRTVDYDLEEPIEIEWTSWSREEVKVGIL